MVPVFQPVASGISGVETGPFYADLQAMTPSHLHPSASIVQLLDDELGTRLNALDVLRMGMTEVLRLKHRLQRSRLTGEGRYLCELCGVPVYLAARPDGQTFVFKHFHEDGSCPHITKGGMTAAQINACRYDGQRESSRHKRIKQLVADSIQCDPRFTAPEIEGTWKGRQGDRRRPDVRSRFNDALDIAFEVQLSTTFGSVMVEREEFYRREGGLLLWVFGEFDPEHARLMMKMSYAVNNRNAYVVNDETLAASREAGTLMLFCHYDQPSLGERDVVFVPQVKMVSFDQLTLDQAGQRAYLVDTDGIEVELKRRLAGPSLAAQLEEFWLMREQFNGRPRHPLKEMDAQWAVLQDRLRKQGVNLPGSWAYHPLVDLLRALYSAKLGESVGWDFPRFWNAAHHVMSAHSSFAWIFYAALVCYGRLPALEAQDKHGKWKKKVSDWRAMSASENHDYDPLILEVFPDLAAHAQLRRGAVKGYDEIPF